MNKFNSRHSFKQPAKGYNPHAHSYHELLPTPSLPNKGGSKELHINVNKSLATWLPSCLAAFTLAEVLITLGIIGVVAAMTLPAVIQNSQKRELHAALLKNYSVLQQALTAMAKDNGDVILPTTYNHLDFSENMLNYLKFIRYCGNSSCINKALEADETGSLHKIEEYMIYSKKKNVYTCYFDDGQFVLQDGSLIMIEHPNYSDDLYITVDVNGFKKRPNAWGHDLFTFQLMNDGKLVPMGMEGTNFTDMNTYCSKTSNHSFNGIACTAYALNDKNYWKNLP